MIKQIFANYEAFYNMVLSSTIMSNAQTTEYKRDAQVIIDFIGKAYGLDQKLTDYCTDVILKELVRIGKTTDQMASYTLRSYDKEYTDMDSLYDLKGDVLATIQNLGGSEDPHINWGWFDYSHYKTYQPEIRFAKIKTASSAGNLITTRQTGLLYAVGIGCEVDYDKAIRRLMQCVMWGDIPAMYYLARTCELAGEVKQAQIMRELADISQKYLNEGCTVIPAKDKTEYSEEARTYYTYVSSIKQDIVSAYGKKNIDFSFIEAILSDSLDYYARMDYINNYERQSWKEVTNSSAKPSKKIGFNF